MNPWANRAPKKAWFEAIWRAAEAWQPTHSLCLDRERVVAWLQESALRQSPWMLHPCVNALTFKQPKNQLQRDFTLAIWAAASAPYDLGTVRIEEPLAAWTPDGGAPVAPGTHQLEDLGCRSALAQWPLRVALDVWCDSLGFAHSNTWAALDRQRQMDEAEKLEAEICNFMRSLTLLEATLPDCATWASDVTQVVIPFYSKIDIEFHSSSHEELPGVIFMDLFPSEIQILETFVHESAHHYLYLYDQIEPLVDPCHSMTYRSPLRKDPRPLRGIFLAYHALAYICCLYRDAACNRWITTDNPDFANLREKMEDAEITLSGARIHLTPTGQFLFDETLAVANYARE